MRISRRPLFQGGRRLCSGVIGFAVSEAPTLPERRRYRTAIGDTVEPEPP
jgi:hypothetical protein